MGEPPAARLDHIFSQGCPGLRSPHLSTVRQRLLHFQPWGLGPAAGGTAIRRKGSCSQGQSIPGVQASLPLT